MMKKIVKGNDFTLRIPVAKMVEGEMQPFPLPACTNVVVNIVNASRRYALAYDIDVAEDNVILARVEGDVVGIGTYALEVKGKLFDNDWRSNEYPQFQIVGENADADTEFGTTDEGDNSVEMDTALVILPPSVELEGLIKDAQSSVKKIDELDETLTANEAVRKENEQSRVSAENARVEAEKSRENAEEGRVSAESARKDSEEQRIANESERQKTETSRIQAEAERVKAEVARANAEADRVKAENNRSEAEKQRISAEETRANNELSRISSEADRISDEKVRIANETERKQNEEARQQKADASIKDMQQKAKAAIEQMDAHKTAFDEAEQARVDAENKRVSAEEQREADFTSTKNACEVVTQSAKDAASEANAAKDSAIIATNEAEKVDASLDGNVLTVTNRNGEKKSVDLTDSDEHVTINATTKVSDASMEGLVINVYINNGAAPQQYTTDSNGQAEFSVVKGSTYKVVFPYVKGCNPINPVQHVASVGNRIIDAEYVAEVIRYEHVTVWMNKENDDNVLMPWESANVYVTISGKKTTYTTDSSGKVTFDVEYGKSYNVSVEKLEGMYEQYDRYSNTRTAIADSYRFKFVYRKYQSGIWLVDDNNKHWTFDDWDASGKDNSHLMFVCIKTLNTQRYNGDIYISIDNLSEFAKFENKQWCPSNVQFKNIPLDGRNNSDTQYYKFVYNGLLATQTIIAEGDERNLQTPACDYCYSMTISNSDLNYQGYLPTIDQWNTAWQNIDMVVEAVNMKYPELHASRQNFSGNKWTSTQNNASFSYYFNTGVGINIKSDWYLAIPFFACLSPSSPLRLSSESEQQDDEQRMAA